MEVLESLWQKFGSWDRFQLRDYTHKKENVPEWVDPQGSSLPIFHADVFRYLQKKDSEGLDAEVKAFRQLSKQLSETK